MKSYYDSEKNAREYISLAAEYDDCGLIEVFRRHVPDNSEVLELGMGPGKDLTILRQHFRATGTDASQSFLDIYLADNPGADVFLLDAVTMATERKFDAIYSNKVLIHLTRDDLVHSFTNQVGVLRPGGTAVHAFWYGTEEEEMHGLRFTYHTEESIREAVAAVGQTDTGAGDGSAPLTIVEMSRYTEMEQDDSIRVVLKRQ